MTREYFENAKLTNPVHSTRHTVSYSVLTAQATSVESAPAASHSKTKRDDASPLPVLPSAAVPSAAATVEAVQKAVPA